MDQVEASGRLVRGNVVLEHLEAVMSGQPTGADIGGENAACGADPIGGPRR